MCRHHKSARQPLEAICVTACSTMAVGSGKTTSSTPIRMRPPAMPKMPDRKAVKIIRSERLAASRVVMAATMDAQTAHIKYMINAYSIQKTYVMLSKAKHLMPWQAAMRSFASLRMTERPPRTTEGASLRTTEMELRHLRYFVAVAHEGHITRAAEKLHIQQPPLSQQIKALEAEIGAALFVRHPRGVALTDAGRSFLADAEAVLAAVDRAAARARRTA